MRLLVSVLLVSALLVACARAFPAFDSSEESEERKNVDTVVVLPKLGMDLFGRPRISDIPDTSSFDVDDSDSYTNVYLGFLRQTLQEMLKKLRDEMSDLASRLPSGPSFIRPWKTPEGANTTSTTKIIDGHVVTVNETSYSDINDNEGMYIRVRVIDVKPQEETTTSDTQGLTTTPVPITDEAENKEVTTTPTRSVETVEEFDNNIPQNEGHVLNA